MKMTRKFRFYLDTSVFGSIFDFEDQRRIEIAKELIEEIKKGIFEAFISPLVLDEIRKAPENIRDELINVIRELKLPLLAETEESMLITQNYLQERILPEKFRDDARHIAIAVFYEMDAIISWNYRHIVNIRVKRMVNAVNLKIGYKPIEILSPEEVIEYGEVES
ncbi:MAG: PIN domain-containing protein [Methanosarcinales archaeon]